MIRGIVCAAILAVIQAPLGYYALTHGYLVAGGLMWWACGYNCCCVVVQANKKAVG